MPGKYTVEIGRVALINAGPDAGKTCAVVDIIDQNRALVDSPHITRQALSFKKMRLTKFVIRIPHGTSTPVVTKRWTEDEVDKKFAATTVSKRLEQDKKRAALTDFDRFKLYKIKQRVNRLVTRKFEKLKAKAKKDKPKPKQLQRKPRTKLNKKKKEKRKSKKEAAATRK